MLVLSRKNGESVWISHGIEVKVLAIRGSTVKLGFSAPPEVLIRREEVLSTRERDEDDARYGALCGSAAD